MKVRSLGDEWFITRKHKIDEMNIACLVKEGREWGFEQSCDTLQGTQWTHQFSKEVDYL